MNSTLVITDTLCEYDQPTNAALNRESNGMRECETTRFKVVTTSICKDKTCYLRLGTGSLYWEDLAIPHINPVPCLTL